MDRKLELQPVELQLVKERQRVEAIRPIVTYGVVFDGMTSLTGNMPDSQ